MRFIALAAALLLRPRPSRPGSRRYRRGPEDPGGGILRPGDGHRQLAHRRLRPTAHRDRRSRSGRRLGPKKLTDWGLKDARLEPWGEFGRGWTNERTMVQVTAPVPFPVTAYPSAWTPGTGGLVSGKVVWRPGQRPGPREVPGQAPRRHRDARGTARGEAPGSRWRRGSPTRSWPRWRPRRHRRRAASRDRSNVEQFRARMQAQQAFNAQRTQFLKDEGVLAVLQPGRGDGGTVFVGGGGPRDPKAPMALPTLVVAIEHYGRICAHAGEGHPGVDGPGRPEHLPRPGPDLLQRDGGDPGHDRSARTRW